MSIERLLDAAVAVFAERGYSNANIHEICARANVGIGTFYTHFDHKKQLLERVMRERARTVAEIVTADDLANMEALVSTIRDVVDDPVSAGLWRAWHQAIFEHDDLAKAHIEWRAQVLELVANVIEQARERAPDRAERLDAKVVAWTLLTIYREYAIHDRGGAPGLEDVARVSYELIFGRAPTRSGRRPGTPPTRATSRSGH